MCFLLELIVECFSLLRNPIFSPTRLFHVVWFLIHALWPLCCLLALSRTVITILHRLNMAPDVSRISRRGKFPSLNSDQFIHFFKFTLKLVQNFQEHWLLISRTCLIFISRKVIDLTCAWIIWNTVYKTVTERKFRASFGVSMFVKNVPIVIGTDLQWLLPKFKLLKLF